jgi:hypothetical protein
MMKTYKTKNSTRNAIYKLVNPLTKGFFHDNSWENVNKVWKALEAEGVTVYITQADYTLDKSKTWGFRLEVNGFSIPGHLVASFCGTVTDPTSTYDLCFII